MDRTATQIKQDAEDQCDVKVQAMESKFEALKSTLVDLSCELCDPIKTSGCDSNGRCICLEGYRGTRCNDCNTGYVRDVSGTCQSCGCSTEGSESLQCDANGQCTCKSGFDGLKCDECAANYYGYPSCQGCECSSEGSESLQCDANGQCTCKPGF